MATKKKKSVSPPKRKTPSRQNGSNADAPAACVCDGNCHEEHAHLPGYLLVAFGLLALPLNLDLWPSLSWVKAWPVVLVMLGLVFLVKVSLCKRVSS